MTVKVKALVGFVTLLLAETSAPAESCTIENSGPVDQWRFVHAYDPDRQEIVLQQAIKGGDRKSVTVSGERVRVDHKLPGGIKYNAGVIAVCKGGNIVKF